MDVFVLKIIFSLFSQLILLQRQLEDPRKDYFFPIYSLIGFFYPMIRFKLASVLLNKDLAAIKVFM